MNVMQASGEKIEQLSNLIARRWQPSASTRFGDGILGIDLHQCRVAVDE